MKIIIAPDSFKGCLRSPEVAEALAAGIASVVPEAETINVPMADGGEGTTEAAVRATGGSTRSCRVSGPLGDPVTAEFGILGNSNQAVMEMAAASGIELIDASQLNPMRASTYGTGEMIKAILDEGVRDVTIGIGGSATVDGGLGMAKALGYRLLDDDGADIPLGGAGLARLRKIDVSTADPRLKKTRFRVASDVTNPLLGANGAARVFGPQKGATPEMVEELEAGLANFAQVAKKTELLADVEHPGDGAAGGLGAALRAFCGAETVSGAELMIELVGLENLLVGADLLITGEGKTDSQTASGKLCAVIADAAKRSGVPVALVSGAIDGNPDEFVKRFDATFSVSTGPGPLEKALASARNDLQLMGRNIAALLRL